MPRAYHWGNTSLKLPNLEKITNNPIRHDPTYTKIKTKLPSDIPMFDNKACKYP